ncbi:hypothetical protein OIY81_2382 [Cryptosporidium canis]|uniref:Uncharacterized protein n=1 Tax=Cryptosporidium canis TaxID=195482 RepID=A0ABQ8P541_9CRYT|nr:hypothetical protein OJ252_2463 [Cryptosporidium canis]KAJ1609366.1 hypothetical protein OIY81_2382 [Cryptosporidium canis]
MIICMSGTVLSRAEITLVSRRIVLDLDSLNNTVATLDQEPPGLWRELQRSEVRWRGTSGFELEWRLGRAQRSAGRWT